ncbi:hypothetical protein [Jeotgalibacillus sp. JSM ZJ347]|uniref:hypothetical protein n=1 Tax=Jeotgalibacillus sp. JSM ZJ347 TaxID=3342117 RepID=UPI0035A8A5B6
MDENRLVWVPDGFLIVWWVWFGEKSTTFREKHRMFGVQPAMFGEKTWMFVVKCKKTYQGQRTSDRSRQLPAQKTATPKERRSKTNYFFNTSGSVL